MSNPAHRPPYLTLATEKLAVTLGENLIGVVLYGSHARGEAREESDVDLLVIARNLPERRYDRSVFLQRILRGIEDAPPFSLLGKHRRSSNATSHRSISTSGWMVLRYSTVTAIPRANSNAFVRSLLRQD